jgi:putative nucleotidyltransferase with HDIG domain
MSLSTNSNSAVGAGARLDVESLIKSIAIPPRPELLTQVQSELARPDPDSARIAAWIGKDVAMAAGVLRIVNSPFYALSRPAGTLEQALSLLGLRQIGTLVTGFALRQAVKGEPAGLTRFWDVSTKRSYAMSALARGLRGVDVDAAQSFGLFCDVGIPLLMQRFVDYPVTLKAANQDPVRTFTEVEQEAHDADHAMIGALMARSWGLPKLVYDAIRQHHDYSVFRDLAAAPELGRLIAMGLVAELAIQRFARLNASMEWNKGGEEAAGLLNLSSVELEDWICDLIDGFALGIA